MAYESGHKSSAYRIIDYSNNNNNNKQYNLKNFVSMFDIEACEWLGMLNKKGQRYLAERRSFLCPKLNKILFGWTLTLLEF
jgi:hypothetical protein